MRTKEEILKRIDEDKNILLKHESTIFSITPSLEEIASMRELKKEIEILEWILEGSI